MAIQEGTAALRGISAAIPILTIGLPKRNTSRRLNGVVLNQNQTPEATDDWKDLNSSTWYYQEWFLPSNLTRGSEDEARVPEISGFQIFVGVDAGFAETASADWVFETQIFGVGWTTLVRGTQIGAAADGDELWYDVYFDTPIDVAQYLGNRFRVGVRGRTASNDTFRRVVQYDPSTAKVRIDAAEISVALQPNKPFNFDYEGKPSVLLLEDGIAYFSVQQGLKRLYYSVPNPLVATGNSRAMTGEGGATPVQDTSRDVSFMFRVLGGTADEGMDFLGNQFRSVVVKNRIGNTSSTSSADVFWLSKPNPSRFAVESLYFDVRNPDGSNQVINRILLDPITHGMFFHVYWAEGTSPAQDEHAWDEKLWNHVPQTFQATKRATYTLPDPVPASFMKIEFSHLQARHYAPGAFQKPVEYKKFPKWVLDYFFLRTEARKYTEDRFVSSRVGVTFDALDLAYNYYLDDLNQEPRQPGDVEPPARNLNQFFSDRGDVSDMIDAETLLHINTVMQPYIDHPGLRGGLDYLPGLYSRVVATTGLEDQLPDYPVERQDTNLSPQGQEVSAINGDAVVFEQSYPVMFYYVKCRHRYRRVSATFRNDRAYFAGVREIAFLRDHYTTTHDHSLYIENADDNLNVERNDFSAVNHVLQTYSDAS